VGEEELPMLLICRQVGGMVLVLELAMSALVPKSVVKLVPKLVLKLLLSVLGLMLLLMMLLATFAMEN